MKPRLFVLSLVATVCATGCANVPMYDGPERGVSEVGRIFTHSPRPNLRILEIDGKPLSFAMTKVLHLLPGTHVFSLYASNYREWGGVVMTTWTKTYDHGKYQIAVPIRAGYTYAIDYPINYSGSLPDRLCILGEPHQAPGSWENYTGEERKMSAGAEIVACGDVMEKTHVSPK